MVDFKQNRHEWMVRRTNKYKRDKYGHIEGENDMKDDNSFAALGEQGDQEGEEGIETKKK